MKNDKSVEELVLDLKDIVVDLKNQVSELKYDLVTIKNKLSMPNGIVQIRNARFFLPYYPMDLIQRWIVDNQNYWYIYDLNIIDKWLPKNPVIIDIGANIGSYSLYWSIEKDAKKIYAFEPLADIYEILCTNIKINNLANVIKPYNMGLSKENMMASIDSYNANNIGGTSFKENKNGKFVFKPLDSIKFKENIDVIKIDVEGNEMDVLSGAMGTISKYHPLIIIESFSYKDKIAEILHGIGYKMVEVIREESDFIYAYDG